MNKRAANRLVWMMVAAMVVSFGSVSIVRGGATKDPVTLIANNTVPVASLTEADIKSIFLGKKTTVEGSKDGKKVKLKGRIRDDLMSTGNIGPILEVISEEKEK